MGGSRHVIPNSYDDRHTCIQGCQFSDFSLISDLLRKKEFGMKLIKYGKNMDKILIVPKYRLDSGKRLKNPYMKTVSKH